MKHVGIAVAGIWSYSAVQGLVVTSSVALLHRIVYSVNSGAVGLVWRDTARAQKLKRCRFQDRQSIRNTNALKFKVI